MPPEAMSARCRGGGSGGGTGSLAFGIGIGIDVGDALELYELDLLMVRYLLPEFDSSTYMDGSPVGRGPRVGISMMRAHSWGLPRGAS
jgi:hypothetical protein